MECQRAYQQGVNFNQLDTSGLALIHSIAGSKHSDSLEFILDHGADPTTRDDEGFTFLHWSVVMGYIDNVKILLNHKRCANYINAKNNDGYTPLHFAISTKSRVDNPTFEIAKVLMEYGANPKIRNHQGHKPSHYCSYAKKSEVDAILKIQPIDRFGTTTKVAKR